MKLKLVILVFALQTAWLLGTVVRQENLLRTGQIVLLETQPVDPRDPLRGDFVRLNYKISDVQTNLFSRPVKKDLPYGTKIFIARAPGTNELYVITRASTNALAPSSDTEVVFSGRIAYAWWNTTNSIHVEYGIERYYVAEGTGNPHGRLTARAVVPASGRAKLQQVFLDGKPYGQAMKQ
jgi:uncharacterized membrane-anchored protein